MAVPHSAAALSSAIESMDHTRGSAVPLFGRRAHKEWHHFVVFADGLDLLINFSCCDTVPARPGRPPELPRLVCLARGKSWDGDIENFALDECRVDNGAIRFDLGRNRLAFRDGTFHLDAALRRRPIQARLELTPATRPVLVPSTPMRDGPPLHWLVVPRLIATGTLVIDGHAQRLDGAPAYHDHNWGHFLWGHDLSWEWGFVLPDDPDAPWCVVFVRLTDRARTTAFDHKLLLWKGAALARSFREGEVETRPAARPFRSGRLFKVPRPLALLVPESAADVPEWFETGGRAGSDWVACRAEPYDVVQVLIPSESDLGVTIFNEVSARARVRGEVDGERIDFTGRSMMEFIRHV